MALYDHIKVGHDEMAAQFGIFKKGIAEWK